MEREAAKVRDMCSALFDALAFCAAVAVFIALIVSVVNSYLFYTAAVNMGDALYRAHTAAASRKQAGEYRTEVEAAAAADGLSVHATASLMHAVDVCSTHPAHGGTMCAYAALDAWALLEHHPTPNVVRVVHGATAAA
jgi:hypothetical protein